MAAGDTASELDQRLAEVEALRRRVLNVIPHALRTPITTFRGLAEALTSASDQQIREEIGPALRRLAAQAEHLLDDMLIAAGYTTTLPTAASEPTPLEATARAVWRDLGGPDDDLVVESSGTHDVLVPRGSLFKLLVHLLDNARKYAEPPVRLVVEGGREDAADPAVVRFEVVTAGAAPPDLDMFLEPFYRGESAVLRSSGLGVGLTVARALVEQAGGSLVVAPGGAQDAPSGMVCRIVLPAAGGGS